MKRESATGRHHARTALVIAVFSACWSCPPRGALGQTDPNQDDKRRLAVAERAAEARYQKLAASESLSAKDWLMLGDWCLMVVDDLSPRSRAVFMQRGRECLQKGKTMTLARLEEIFSSAATRLAAASGLDDALGVREAAEEESRSFLADIVPIARQHEGQLRILAAHDEHLAELDRLLAPLSKREGRTKVLGNFVPLHGRWVPMDEPTGTYDGFVPLEQILDDPAAREGRLVATEISTTLEVFDLLDLALLDGFAPDGRYVVPNFMEDRLVISLPPDARRWITDSAELTSPGSGSEAPRPKYRTRLLFEVDKEYRQYTFFHEGRVRHVAVFDEAGDLVDQFNAGH